MAYFVTESDINYAYRVQMENDLAAAYYNYFSHTPPQTPWPPVMSMSGVDAENFPGWSGFMPISVSPYLRPSIADYGHEAFTRYHQNPNPNPNFTFDSLQNTPRYYNRRPSPTQSFCQGALNANAYFTGRLSENAIYRLYFKGVASQEAETTNSDVAAGFGVAICDEGDNLLFDFKEPLIGPDMDGERAEIIALTRGLYQAMNLGIQRLVIYFDSHRIFELVRWKLVPKQNKISMLMNDLQWIMQRFLFIQPLLVNGNDVKFVYKLAWESIESRGDPSQATFVRKENCLICYNDTEAELMFSVGDKCNHRFCLQCVIGHAEANLLLGKVPKCLNYGCKSDMVIDVCGKLLTPELSNVWRQRVIENAIPFTERVYCPYMKCSVLMSKTEVYESAKSLTSMYPEESEVSRCIECRGLFCVECKVPWHENMSCAEYKRLNPNPPMDDLKLKSLASDKMWRQCSKCQHMIELIHGCNHVTCRCEYEFCYSCGGEWNKKMGCNNRCRPGWIQGSIHQYEDVDFDYLYDMVDGY
ncbi:unnamed protein product [Cochlearia groenlandica]